MPTPITHLCFALLCLSGGIRHYYSLDFGCWFHYSQAMLKRVNKLGLKDYQNRDDIKDIIRCILGLALLPAADIPTGLQEVCATICNDTQMAQQLQQLVTYDQRQWIHTGNATTSTDSSDTSDRCDVKSD